MKFTFFFLLLFKLVSASAQGKMIPFREGNDWYYVDEFGTELSPVGYQEAYPFYDNGSVAAVKNNGKYGFINSSFELIIPYQYDYADSKHGNMLVVLNNETLYIDRENQITTIRRRCGTIAYQYSKNNIITVNNKMGVTSSSGEVLIQPIYQNIEIVDRWEAIFATNDEGKIGVFNNSGVMTYPFMLDSFVVTAPLESSVILIYEDNLVGAVHYNGELLVKPTYNEISVYFPFIYVTLVNGKKGFIYKDTEYWID